MQTGVTVLRHEGTTLHREGRGPVLVAALAACVLSVLAATRRESRLRAAAAGAIAGLAFLTQFFRHPGADTPLESGLVIAPAFGRVVHIGTENEPELLGDRRMRISIFLSVFDPHLVRAPVGGRIIEQRYTPGRYLVALHPKASTLNERSSVLIEGDDGVSILVRSIAGLLARRICSYATVGMRVDPGEEVGYIKLGSRVDVFLPPQAAVLVKIGEYTRAGETPLARIGPGHR
jgi:phosphatidylserine decarboxylase